MAAEQHGVVSAAQLRGIGFATSGIGREVSADRLHRLHQGVYAVGHPAVSRHGRCLAAVLARGDGAVLSHRSAAWLWGFTRRWERVIEVTAATPRDSEPGIRVHSSKRIQAEDITELEGIPTTAPARTLLDVAAVDPGYLAQALDNAARLGRLDLWALDDLLSRSRGLRGVARLRAAVDLHRDPSFTRSGLERRFLRLVREAGLPRPSVNFFVAGHEVDMYWPEEGLAVELDTYDHHGGRRQFEADRIRDESLRLAGIEVARITGRRLDRDPSGAIASVAALLSSAARRGPPRDADGRRAPRGRRARGR